MLATLNTTLKIELGNIPVAAKHWTTQHLRILCILTLGYVCSLYFLPGGAFICWTEMVVSRRDFIDVFCCSKVRLFLISKREVTTSLISDSCIARLIGHLYWLKNMRNYIILGPHLHFWPNYCQTIVLINPINLYMNSASKQTSGIWSHSYPHMKCEPIKMSFWRPSWK